MNYEQIKKYQNAAAKMDMHKFISYQNSYNLIVKHRLRNKYGVFLLNDQEKSELRTSLIAYRSLVNGFLAGKYKKGEQYQMESDGQKAVERNCFNENGWVMVNTLEEIAASKNATVMQITLAAYRYDSKLDVSLVGFAKSSQIEEAIRSMDIELSEKELKDIDEASQRFAF